MIFRLAREDEEGKMCKYKDVERERCNRDLSVCLGVQFISGTLRKSALQLIFISDNDTLRHTVNPQTEDLCLFLCSSDMCISDMFFKKKKGQKRFSMLC